MIFNINMTKKDIFIIGTGGHSRVIIDCAEKNKFNIKGLIDINYSSKNLRVWIACPP